MLPCVSVLPLPRACLGPTSPACPPHLSPTLVSLWLSLCQHAHTDGTFRKSALESNVSGPEAIEEGFRSPPGRIYMQAAAGVSLASPPKGKGPASSVIALCPVLWRYLSQVESFTPTLTSTQDTFKVRSMGVATSK